MKLLYLALLLPLSVSAEQLQPLAKPELATVLGLLEELTPATQHSEQPFIVRIYAAPEQISECDGSVASCPDVRLFFTVSSGDILEGPRFINFLRKRACSSKHGQVLLEIKQQSVLRYKRVFLSQILR